jgi:hypothetical protein
MRIAMVVAVVVMGCGSALPPVTAHPSPLIASLASCAHGASCDGGSCTIFLSPEVGDQTPRCIPADQNARTLLNCDAPATCFDFTSLPDQLTCAIHVSP